MSGLLFQAFVYLCAAVIAVPIAKRLGLGSVLGYLLAGIVIGPIIGLVGSETQEIQHFAEFGVVMMLFLVGLELQPRMLWEMRHRLIGLGGLQVGLTALLITVVAMLLGIYWTVALTIGLIFSLSSTAIVLQTLNEKNLSKTEGGRASFSILLFQDIAVIPMLALIPLLVVPDIMGSGAESGLMDSAHQASDNHHENHNHNHNYSLVADLPTWGHALVVLGAVATVLLGGHFLSRPLFRLIAESKLREIFTASALLLVIGIALLMTLVELSPALGTFLAGVVLANSEFRHELESNIEPFKGLLLGLFFITVGAGIDFKILLNDFALVLSLTLGVIFIKGIVLYSLARLFKLELTERWLVTLGLAQAGEFGFVLLNFSLQQGVVPADLASTLSLVVAMSMLLTPVLFILYDQFLSSHAKDTNPQEPDTIDETGTIIIAGNGRFGQIVNRLLVASEVKTVVLDHEAAIIDILSKIGMKSYYGDASRPDLLHSAGIENAIALVIAIDDRERAVEMVEYVKRHYPQVKILARAYDVNHLYLLNKAGVDYAIREMFESSFELGKAVLSLVEKHPLIVEKRLQTFRKHDSLGLEKLYEHWDENTATSKNKAFLARAREHSATLKEMMKIDRLDLDDVADKDWTPPPKGNEDKFHD